MTQKTLKTISLSDLFSINVEEAKWDENRTPEKGVPTILISEKTDKQRTIDSIIEVFTKEGDLRSLGMEDNIRIKLEFLMAESVNLVSEEILRKGVFTFWRNGETMLVLKKIEGPDELDGIVVKMARPDKDFERNALLGYKIAKSTLSHTFGIPMSILRDIRLNVRDSSGVPRCVLIGYCVIQERVIVAKDIFASVESERKTLINKIMIRERLYSKALKDEKVKFLSKIMTGMKMHFQEWYDAVGLLGIYDKDIDYITGMDRNYGFCVPKTFIPSKGRNRDWGLNDYLELRSEKKIMIAGFDFDSFRMRLGAKLKKHCAPDVFEERIKGHQRNLLEKIITRRA